MFRELFGKFYVKIVGIVKFYFILCKYIIPFSFRQFSVKIVPLVGDSKHVSVAKMSLKKLIMENVRRKRSPRKHQVGSAC